MEVTALEDFHWPQMKFISIKQLTKRLRQQNGTILVVRNKAAEICENIYQKVIKYMWKAG
jgi:hypothetical protein